MYEGHRGRLSLGGRGLRKEKRGWIMVVRKREHAELRLAGSYAEGRRYHTKPHTSKLVI